MTYSELFEKSVIQLKNASIEEASSDVTLLFDYILGVDRAFMFMNGNDTVPADACDKLLNAVSIREKRVPLQHITGFQNFMGLEFKVSKDVLVPRFDTECLVEEAMLVTNDNDKVLDICTGSGCIIISLMNYKNGIEGYGADISKEALNLANENAVRLCKPDNKPQFILSDLFEGVNHTDFDVIVSNPPYIKTSDIETLMSEVKDYDPYIALDGGEDGLLFYREIALKAPDYLKKGGYLLVEIGFDEGDAVKELLIQNGFDCVKIIKDLAGCDRVVSGRKQR